MIVQCTKVHLLQKLLILFSLLSAQMIFAQTSFLDIQCAQKNNQEVVLKGSKAEVICQVKNNSSGPVILQNIKSYDEKCKWVYKTNEKSREPLLPHAQSEVKIECQTSEHDPGVFGRSLIFTAADRSGKSFISEKYFSTNVVDQATLKDYPNVIKERKKTQNDDQISAQLNRPCDQVDMRKAGGSVEHIPLLEQQQGICFAHAAAEMYDAWRFAHGDTRYDQLSSRVSAAYRYKKITNDKELDAGKLRESLNELKKNAPCPFTLPKNEGESDWFRFVRVPKAPYEEKEKFTSDFTDSFKLVKEEYKKSDRVWGLFKSNVFIQKEDELNNLRLKSVLSNCSKNSNVPLTDTPQLVKYLKDDNIIGALEVSISMDCKDSEKLKIANNYKVQEDSLDYYPTDYDKDEGIFGRHILPKQKSLLEQIQKNLDGGNTSMPVGIAYCYDSTRDESSFDWKKNNASKDKDECGAHSALIVGRALNSVTHKCEFIIQNTTGENGPSYQMIDAVRLTKNLKGIVTIGPE